MDIERDLWSIVQNLNISPKSEFFYMRKENTGNDFMIHQFYRIEMEMPIIVENFGRIVDDIFIDFRPTPITSRRRSNLFGLHLNASMVITDNDTLNHLTDYKYEYSLTMLFSSMIIKVDVNFKFIDKFNVIH